MKVKPASAPHLPVLDQQRDLLSACVHCGFCLEACPTYQLTGDENNSPRGRLRLWREEREGTLPQDPWTAFYTSECVGCLACEPVCPAGVQYGAILEETRHAQVAQKRFHPKLELRLAATAVNYPALFNLALAPARALRRASAFPHPLIFPGKPAVFKSTAAYARDVMDAIRPNGPRVALLTGCLMDAMFREINFSTIRVLARNNVQVVIPEGQGCCGAFQEHTGLDGVNTLRERNQKAFADQKVDLVLSNSAGCGLALKKTLEPDIAVMDVLGFLGELGIRKPVPAQTSARVYVDLPCHLVHGQRTPGIPADVLDAMGLPWELAPCATECCGSGGIYNIQKPENARKILQKKSTFLDDAVGTPVILATSNHVCMMQWNSAKHLVNRPFRVAHVVQLLDEACQTDCS